MILVKDITADPGRCLYLQENLAASGAESLHQTLGRLHSQKLARPQQWAAVERARPQQWAAVAPCCAVQLAPLIVRTSASAGMVAHGIRI